MCISILKEMWVKYYFYLVLIKKLMGETIFRLCLFCTIFFLADKTIIWTRYVFLSSWTFVVPVRCPISVDMCNHCFPISLDIWTPYSPISMAICTPSFPITMDVLHHVFLTSCFFSSLWIFVIHVFQYPWKYKLLPLYKYIRLVCWHYVW